MKRFMTAALALVAAAAFAGPAAAATGTLYGSATVEGDHVKIVSDVSDAVATNDFGGIRLTGTGVTTFASLTTLSAQFNVTDDSCQLGSPRFELDFAGTTNNVFVYLGTVDAGNYVCAPNTWLSTGNLIGSTDLRFDLTKFGGPFYGTYAQALALVGGLALEEVRFVVDGGNPSGDKEQTVLVKQIVVNSTTFSWQQQTGMNPAQTCRDLRNSMGAVAFADMYGDNVNNANAFGKCVSWHAKHKAAATASATKACVKQGKKGKALRACVTTQATKTYNAKAQKLRKAGTSCKAERTAGEAAFRTKYGKGKNKANAMAGCVRAKLG